MKTMKKTSFLLVSLFGIGLLAGCNKQQEPPAHEHAFSELIAQVNPTCTEDGMSAHYTCSGCDKLFDTNKKEVSKESLIIDALGHDFSANWIIQNGKHFHSCSRCDAHADEERHNLVHHEQLSPTHVAEGYDEYWQCSVCEALFSDSQGLTQIENVVTHDPLGHDSNLTCHEKEEANCGTNTNGHETYYECSCGALFSDSQGEHQIDAPVPIVYQHDYVSHDEEAATCSKTGMLAHFTCKNCDKYFDTNKKEVSKESLIIDTLDHNFSSTWVVENGKHYHTCSECGAHGSESAHTLVHIEQKNPTHSKSGSEEYWQCSVCEALFSDSQGLTQIEKPAEIAPLGHDKDLTYHAEVEPNCSNNTPGNEAYYECSCGVLFSDAEGQNELAEKPIIYPNHNYEYHAEVPSTCTETGVEAYYECTACNRIFSDNKGTEIVTPVIIPIHHDLSLIDEVSSTCTETGVEAYYECSECHKLFSDAEGQNEINDPAIIPATGHLNIEHHEVTSEHIEYWECTQCHHAWADENKTIEISENTSTDRSGIDVARPNYWQVGWNSEAYPVLPYYDAEEGIIYKVSTSALFASDTTNEFNFIETLDTQMTDENVDMAKIIIRNETDQPFSFQIRYRGWGGPYKSFILASGEAETVYVSKAQWNEQNSGDNYGVSILCKDTDKTAVGYIAVSAPFFYKEYYSNAAIHKTGDAWSYEPYSIEKNETYGFLNVISSNNVTELFAESKDTATELDDNKMYCAYVENNTDDAIYARFVGREWGGTAGEIFVINQGESKLIYAYAETWNSQSLKGAAIRFAAVNNASFAGTIKVSNPITIDAVETYFNTSFNNGDWTWDDVMEIDLSTSCQKAVYSNVSQAFIQTINTGLTVEEGVTATLQITNNTTSVINVAVVNRSWNVSENNYVINPNETIEITITYEIINNNGGGSKTGFAIRLMPQEGTISGEVLITNPIFSA